MSHIVVFTSGEGKTGYHQTDSVEDALRFVEHLRNQEKVEDARLFRMEEVPLEVRTYFKVELAGSGANPTPPGSPRQSDAPSPVTTDPMTGEPLPVGAGTAANRFGLFNR